MLRCVIFDLDGTLVDSMEGIYQSYCYALHCLGMELPEKKFIQNVVGDPLPYVFRNIFSLDEKTALDAVSLYRKYYGEKGKVQTVLYPGIKDCLHILKNKGLFLGIATLKREDFAKDILRHLKIENYFDIICGVDKEDRIDKCGLIKKCIVQCGCRESEAVLIGDTRQDALGAAKAGIAFLAVTYGFGFHDQKELEKYNIKKMASSPETIPIILKI